METKKIIYLVFFGALFLTLNTANAQLESGSLLIGGDVGFSSFSPKGGGGSVTSFNISPAVGYFVIDNLALGAKINYNSASAGGETESIFAAGPFARYYIGDSKIFGEAMYGFGSTSFAGNSSSLSIIQVAVGYAAFLNDHVALEPEFYWNTQSVEGENIGSTIGLNIGLQIYIGK